MRGEDPARPDHRRRNGGSPPHARGRRTRRTGKANRTRITPACAGKTSVCIRVEIFTGDHPRMRGEDLSRRSIISSKWGSPPHARGRRRAGHFSASNERITPACAGKTDRSQIRVRLRSDHPRMRGEDIIRDLKSQVDGGSPPHARGRRIDLVRDEALFRITPACAGKTFETSANNASLGDHPRMRGEDRAEHLDISNMSGSPPHARGRR